MTFAINPILGSDVQLIDMHTHMFNSRYVPLIGILRRFGVSKKLSKYGAKIAWAITGYSKFRNLKRAIPTHIDTTNPGFSLIDSHEDPSQIDSYIHAIVEDYKACWRDASFSEAYSEDVPFPELLAQIRLGLELGAAESENEDNYNGYANELLESAEALFEYDLDAFSERSQSLAFLGDKNSGWLGNILRELLQEIVDSTESGIDFIDFFWNMTQKEEEQLERLVGYYETLNLRFGMVHYMMDMSAPFAEHVKIKKAGKVKIPFYKKEGRSQLSQMKKLQETSKGRLKGFSAFDPWRFENEPEDRIFKTLQSALSDYNMMGFKFYPPMGFHASNKPRRLTRVIDIFLKFCVINDVPVFAHCTPGGFEVEVNSGTMSDPTFWREAMNDKSWQHDGVIYRARDLRLCLGHAGGGKYSDISDGWVAESLYSGSNNYARTVIEMCNNFPNVYCELANIDSILSKAAHAENLRNNLHMVLGASPSFHNKIMYGTDWHMVGMVNDVIQYFYILYQIVDEYGDDLFKSKFFHGNALNYLKLAPGGFV